MDLSRGFDLTPSMQERLRLLDWVADNGGRGPRAIVSLAPLFQGQDPEAAASIIANLEALEANGVLRLHKTLGWAGWSCDVTSPGVDLIESLRSFRGDLLGRRKASRDAVVIWLHDCTLRGNAHPVISAFAESRWGSYYGHAFTGDEVATASKWLKQQGYIAGSEAWGAGVLRPSITTKGERIVESGRSVNDDSPAAANEPVTVNTVTVTGTGNVVAAHSPGAVQTATVTLTEGHRTAVIQLADAVEQFLPVLGLQPAQVVKAQATACELREVANDDAADRGRLAKLLDNVKVIALGGAGGAFGNGLAALAEQTARALGMGG